VKVLLVSADPATRQQMGITMHGIERAHGEPVELIHATDGVQGIRLAWKHLPAVVVADEITSRAGAFALARDLKGASVPFPGTVVILLERSQDTWLARWSGADAWFVKPVDPFELADAVGVSTSLASEEAV
jgi:DNA-binding response OmpR family regulator